MVEFDKKKKKDISSSNGINKGYGSHGLKEGEKTFSNTFI